MLDTSPFIVRPGANLSLADIDPRATTGYYGKKTEAKDEIPALRERIDDLQHKLWAESEQALLVVLQGIDTSGKDGTIRYVFKGVNPQGVRVASFVKPSTRELSHDYLWRVHEKTPRRGSIMIFNRSHYEDVLVVRVNNLVPEERWSKRYEHIRQWEQLLTDEGTTVVKFFLHISKKEQLERLQERANDLQKNWKFDEGDLETRRKWDAFQEAYQVAINETSTANAPWYVVPADRKWFRNLLISTVLVETLERMDPQRPAPNPALADLVID